jgi:Ino eighty subunit 1
VGTNRVAQPNPTPANGNEMNRDNDDTEDERLPSPAKKQDVNGDTVMEEAERLDPVSRDDDEAKTDEDLDDVDKELLGLGGDETEEEGSDGGMDVDSAV